MQTQFQNLQELAVAVDRVASQRHDVVATTTELTMTDDVKLRIGDVDTFDIDPHAHRQIGQRIGIPAKYYDRMRKEAPDLLADNVNTWFRKRPENRLVRALVEGDGNQHVRAFLSDRYQRIDNDHILKSIIPVLDQIAERYELKMLSGALTGTRMYLKMSAPEIRAEVKVGDIVESGFEFRNGEIGNSRFEVWPFVNRLVCLNGMRLNVAGIKKMHVGGRADVGEEGYELLSDETLELDDKVLMLKARDVVQGLLTHDSFQKVVDRFRETTEEKVEGDPGRAIEVLSDKLDLNETERGGVLRHLIEGGDLSRWGVANAVTRTAQDVEDYDRATELEGFGGKLIELPRGDWREIAGAKPEAVAA